MTKEPRLFCVWVFWLSLKCSVIKGNEGKLTITQNLTEQDKRCGTHKCIIRLAVLFFFLEQ